MPYDAGLGYSVVFFALRVGVFFKYSEAIIHACFSGKILNSYYGPQRRA